jgi:hypothetical protein
MEQRQRRADAAALNDEFERIYHDEPPPHQRPSSRIHRTSFSYVNEEETNLSVGLNPYDCNGQWPW